MRDIYENDIISTIEESFKCGNLSRDDMNLLISLTRKLFEHLYSKYRNKEVDDMLHDESLDLEIDKYIDALEAQKEELAKKDAELAVKDEELAVKDKEIRKLKAALATKP